MKDGVNNPSIASAMSSSGSIRFRLMRVRCWIFLLLLQSDGFLNVFFDVFVDSRRISVSHSMIIMPHHSVGFALKSTFVILVITFANLIFVDSTDLSLLCIEGHIYIYGLYLKKRTL